MFSPSYALDSPLSVHRQDDDDDDDAIDNDDVTYSADV